MKAYAVLQGGGVKGAALAGCLKAAEDLNIEFVGIGGTSAGSIVALLSSVGYGGDELREILTREIQFNDLLDDDGNTLAKLKRVYLDFTKASNLFQLFASAAKHGAFIKDLNRELGLYSGKKIRRFLQEKIKAKQTSLRLHQDVTFYDLQNCGCIPFKAVVSDITLRKPRVYSGVGGAELNGSVLDAVQASMCFPLVFQPVKVAGAFLVDGGISSNLPIFLFEEERKRDGLPLIAFSLVSTPNTPDGTYGLKEYACDVLSTAVDSTDYLQKQIIENIHYVPVEIPKGIGTLDFHLSAEEAQTLFTAGVAATHGFFRNLLPHWTAARNLVESLQALHAPNFLVTPALKALAMLFEINTPARNIRSSVMLKTPHGTRVVVYQYNMENDPDFDLELDFAAGCTGRAWASRNPVFADLQAAKTDYAEWGMTQPQQSKVRPDRESMFAVPIFNIGATGKSAKAMSDLEVIGTIAVDSSTPLSGTQWKEQKREFALATLTEWANIVGKLIS